MKNILFINVLALAFLLTSCGKEEPQSLPAKVEWTEAPGFTLSQKRAFNAAIWDDQLFILTEKSVAETTVDGKAFHRFHPGGSSDFKLPFSEDYFISLERDGLGFHASKNPQMAGNNRLLRFEEIGVDIVAMHPWMSAGTIALNAQSQILAPFVRSDGSGVLALMDVQMKDYGSYLQVDKISVQLIELYDFSWIGAINAIGDNFFVSFSSISQNVSGTARISPDGDVNLVLNHEDFLQRMMPINGEWYAAAKDQRLFQSGNEGLNWTTSTTTLGAGLKDFSTFTMGYTLIDGQTVFYNQGAIFIIANDPAGGFVQKAVTMEGLQGNTITAVAAWEDKVFVTTLSGVYYISKTDFLESGI